jgi:histone-lysine N-methyltransferase SUV420H
LDDSSSEDEKQPETPEDDQSPVVEVVEPEEDDLPSLSLSRGSLTLKPTPFSFAKSRWNGPSTSLGHVIKKTPPLLDISGVESPSLDQDIVLSPLSDDGYTFPFSNDNTFDDNTFPHKLRHTYPVLQPASASNSCIPQSTTFPFLNSGITPSFINAGWDDASDASEA